jgi:hypothetical protein
MTANLITNLAVVAALAAAACEQEQTQARGPIEATSGPDVSGIMGCLVFEDENFEGASDNALEGKKSWYRGDDWNDKISSIVCHSGCVMTTYEWSDYGGDSHIWKGNTAFVGDDWNDKISSLAVECVSEKPPS